MITPDQWPRAPRRAALAASIALLANATLRAEDVVTVPRKEWEQMKREMAEMHRELRELKSGRSAAAPAPAPAPTTAARTSTPPLARDGALAALEAKVTELGNVVALTRPGENQMLVAGGASSTWAMTDQAYNHTSGFTATFSPVFLWHLNDQLSFESEVDFGLAGTGTTLALRYAQIDWALNDNLTLVTGKFVSPMNAFAERYEPVWINPLPDVPLGIYGGHLPNTNVGFQLRGVTPLWSPEVKLNGALFAGNAPIVQPDNDPLVFSNNNVGRNNIAVGGRTGLELGPKFEIGYGWEYARGQQEDTSNTTSVFLQSIDLQTWINAMNGRWTLQGQYGWDHVGRGHYVYPYSLTTEIVTASELIVPSTVDGANTVDLSNRREGGYLQLTYRGTRWNCELMNQLELVVRADRATDPGYRFTSHPMPFSDATDVLTIPSYRAQRISFGIDYWLTCYTALKAAFEIESQNNFSKTGDAILVGLATGL